MPDPYPAKIRTFLAIELSPTIKHYLADLQQHLRAAGLIEIKWVEPENIHLTLKFLGDVSLPQIESIKTHLRTLGENFHPLQLTIDQIGGFPSLAHSRIIWVGIHDNSNQLASLAAHIEGRLTKIGCTPADRPFNPHLTLGRIKKESHSVKLETFTEDLKIQPLTQTSSHVSLIQSTLTPSGPVYTPIEVFSFRTIK